MNIIVSQGNTKSFIIIALWMTSFVNPVPIKAQPSTQHDTIKIQEVVITRKQISSEQPGFKFYDIDSVRQEDYSLSSLTELLHEATPLFIKNYGSGGSATSSFRGTSAGHTQVSWNGININDPMLGQSDFSLIPSGMIDNIMVSFGGASMDLGSGAIGGIINLENEAVWVNMTLIDALAGVGSYGRYSALIKARTGGQNFHSVTKAYIATSNNNFHYLDNSALPVPELKIRENNETSQKGFMQEFYLRKSENVLSARIWYQSASRNLPGSTQYGYAGEKQYDESFRSQVNYDGVRGANEFFATAAFMLGNLNYKSELFMTDSRNKTNTYVIKGGLTIPMGEYSRLKIILNDELNEITSNNYSSIVRRNNANLTVSAERKKGRRFGAVVLLRETLDNNHFLLPDFSTGLEYRLFRGEEHYLKLNISRNSKIPSLNDQFWNPGGNPGLRNEYAYSFEAGYKLNQILSPGLSIYAEANYFNNYIRDLIQWHPGDSYFWVADNIGSVNTTGTESSACLKYKSGVLSVNINADYSFTRAWQIEDEAPVNKGKQLIYIPKNQASSSVHVFYGNFYSIWTTGFTGRIYTTNDNSEFLDHYTINSFTAGAKLIIKENSIDLRFKIENMFDVSYQSVAFYPQPGRSYFLTFSYQFRSRNE
jgi:vitamin B12 transporter